MNISTKCNCCVKEDVCSIKKDYIADVERINAAIKSNATRVTISCIHQMSTAGTIRRGGAD